MLQLQRDAHRWRVVAAACAEVPVDTGEPTQAWYRDALAAHLSHNRFIGTDVVAVVPDAALRVDRLRINQRRGVHRAARAVADMRLGLSATDECRFFHAGRVRHHGRLVHEILALACSSASLKQQLSLFDSLQLRCERLDVACACVARVQARISGHADECVCIDVGERDTRITVSSARRIRYTQRVEMGGQALRHALAMTQATASSAAHEGRVQRAVEPAARLLGRAVERATTYCRATFCGRGPRTLFYTGDSVAGASVLKSLSAQTGLPPATLQIGSIIDDAEGLLGSTTGAWVRVTGLLLTGRVQGVGEPS